jgi:hypothetical protein
MAREPLRYNVPIVDANGVPTETFQRLWAESVASRGPVFRLIDGQTPQTRGDLVVTITGDDTLIFQYKGSDGVTRSGSVALV